MSDLYNHDLNCVCLWSSKDPVSDGEARPSSLHRCVEPSGCKKGAHWIGVPLYLGWSHQWQLRSFRDRWNMSKTLDWFVIRWWAIFIEYIWVHGHGNIMQYGICMQHIMFDYILKIMLAVSCWWHHIRHHSSFALCWHLPVTRGIHMDPLVRPFVMWRAQSPGENSFHG